MNVQDSGKQGGEEEEGEEDDEQQNALRKRKKRILESIWPVNTTETVQLQLVQANVQLKHDVSFSEQGGCSVIVFLWLLQYILDILTILALSAECKQV